MAKSMQYYFPSLDGPGNDGSVKRAVFYETLSEVELSKFSECRKNCQRFIGRANAWEETNSARFELLE
jgi:hypothetical protein